MSELHQALGAPVTGRHARQLAYYYGYGEEYPQGIEALMGDIPACANVIDVGSGISNLGITVARNRPDITWVNYDFGYHLPENIQRLGAVPPNVYIEPGDITQPLKQELLMSFDNVFSYYLLPHLSLEENKTPAAAAAANMLQLLKMDGLLQVGPTEFDFDKLEGAVVKMRKPETAQKTAAAIDTLVASTMMPPRVVNTHLNSNRRGLERYRGIAALQE